MSRFKVSWLLVAALAMVFSVGFAACGGDDDDETTDTDVAGAQFDLVIGNLVPLTGALSEFGPPGEKAAEMAVQQVSEALEEAGVEGVNVSLSSADTETTPQAATQAARQLIADGASCIAGAWASDNTVPVGRTVAARDEVPLISPASTSPAITDLDDNGYVFRTAPSDALQGVVLADTVEEELGGTDFTVSTAARNDAYGEGIINTFRESWEERGGQVTGEAVLYDPEQPSYSSEAGQIVSGDPDAFVIIDFEEPYNALGAALARTGDFDPEQLFTADGLAFDEIPDTIPAESLDGASGTRPATPEGTGPGDAFAELYEEAPGPSERGTFDAQNFDAVMLCALAAIAAGSSEGSEIREQIQNVASAPGDTYDFTQLSEAITALQNGEEIDFEGVVGSLDLDDNGDPIVATYEVFTYADGALEVERQVEQESPEAEGADGDEEDEDTGTETE